MKKFYLIIFLAGIILLSYGQVVPEKFTNSTNAEAIDYQYSLKGDGQVFFYEDFNWVNPDDIRGWSLPDGWALHDFTLTDSTDGLGYDWYWMAPDSIISSWTEEPPFTSTSNENGYIANAFDWYNMQQGLITAAERIDGDNAIELPPIDCSSHASVIYRMEHNFMNYSSGTNQIEVSVDDWVHIATYSAREGCGHKERPLDANAGEAVIFEVNISDVAAGSDNVRIRIRWLETDAYYWVIDDVSLSEAWDNDLQIRHKTLEYDILGTEDVNESVYYMIPKTQLGGGGFTNFEAGLRNFGEFDQTDVKLDVEIIKNNLQVFHAQSDGTSAPAQGDPDTLFVNEKYIPEDYGHYAIKMKHIASAADNYPEDNLYVREFHVTDSVYSRADDTWEFNFSTGHERYSSLTEGWIDYAIFPIRTTCEVNSLSIFLTGGDEEIDFRFIIIDPNVEEGELPYELIATEFMDMDSSLYFTWTTLEFEKDGESEFLLEGQEYYAGIQYWYETDSTLARRNRNLRIGSDRELRIKDRVSGYSTNLEDYNHYSQHNFLIRMNINNHDNIIDGIPATNTLNSLEQNYPNPFSGLTDINYMLVSGGEVDLEVCDVTGRTVMYINEGYQPAGKHKINLNAEHLNSGIYYYTLKTNNFSDTRKMIISK